MRISDIGEFGLIEILSRQLPKPSKAVVRGIGDDAAVIQGSGTNSTLLTTDMLVEDIHFTRKYCSAYDIGWKSLAVNVSDIGAMGGLPTVGVVSLAIPVNWTVEELTELYRGLGAAALCYGVSIVGGDTVKSLQGLTINVALLGEAEPDSVVYRSGAKPGDAILVTGTLGDSAAGLAHLQNPEVILPAGCGEALAQRYQQPMAQVRGGYNLAKAGLVNAMNDISDGLASEIHEICKASGVGCHLMAENIPLAEATRFMAKGLGVNPLDWALFGGEDFQLVVTLDPGRVNQTQRLLTSLGVSAALVGEITSGTDVLLVQASGEEKLQPRGFNHFTQQDD